MKSAERIMVCRMEIPMDFRTFFDLANVFLVVLSESGNVAMINPKGCKILGMEDSQIVGQNWFKKFIPLADRKKTLGAFRNLMRGKLRPFEVFENRILTAKGVRLFRWNNSYMKSGKGEIQYTYSAGVDITDLKKKKPKSKRKG